jgi:CheY-like chemotaxis protein
MSTPRPILVAENNPQDVELMLNTLQGLNLPNEIVVVQHGADVLDFLHQRKAFGGRPALQPALVLLDIKMPHIDGFDVLRQIRADDELRTVPVVILASSREESDVVKGYELGANGYIVKPVDFEEFVSTVSQLGVFWALINEPPPIARHG